MPAEPDLPDHPWPVPVHRQALAALVTAGRLPSGIGDRAVGPRPPAGGWVARVRPFRPAYAAFSELCHRRPGHCRPPREGNR